MERSINDIFFFSFLFSRNLNPGELFLHNISQKIRSSQLGPFKTKETYFLWNYFKREKKKDISFLYSYVIFN